MILQLKIVYAAHRRARTTTHRHRVAEFTQKYTGVMLKKWTTEGYGARNDLANLDKENTFLIGFYHFARLCTYIAHTQHALHSIRDVRYNKI